MYNNIIIMHLTRYLCGNFLSEPETISPQWIDVYHNSIGKFVQSNQTSERRRNHQHSNRYTYTIYIDSICLMFDCRFMKFQNTICHNVNCVGYWCCCQNSRITHAYNRMSVPKEPTKHTHIAHIIHSTQPIKRMASEIIIVYSFSVMVFVEVVCWCRTIIRNV